MALITNSTISTDQDKYLVDRLLERAEMRLVLASLCDQDTMQEGAGLIAYMVRYKRIPLPVATLTEGVAPSSNTMSLEQVTVTMDQWGDFLEISDVAELTANHPLMQQAQEVLADNAARLMDREIQLVVLAGTSVYYGDASVSSRISITGSMKVSTALLNKIRAQLVRAGAPPRGRKSQDAKQVQAQGNFLAGREYVAVAGPEVIGDITEMSGFVSYAQYSNARALEMTEVGMWAGFRWVETNFNPVYKLLGGTTAAVATGNAFGTDTPVVTAVGSGGSLTQAATYYYKVTRESADDGFEDEISVEHTTAATAGGGNDKSMTFNFSSLTAGYRYNLYFGSSTGDANLKLHTANIEVGTTVTVTAVPGSSVTPPTSLGTLASLGVAPPSAVHPIYFIGAAALGWTGFYKPKFLRTQGAQKSDPLDQKRTVGYKFFGKAVIKDQSRLVRAEVASANG